MMSQADPAPTPPAAPKRPRPRLDAENTPFWTGGQRGELNITRCNDCGEYTHPPKPLCRHCLSENIAAHAVTGTGVVDSYTVNYQAWMPGLPVPYVIARVRLDDVPGVILTTNIVGCGVDEVDFDDKVRVTFEEQDGIWFPLFEKIVEKVA